MYPTEWQRGMPRRNVTGRGISQRNVTDRGMSQRETRAARFRRELDNFRIQFRTYPARSLVNEKALIRDSIK
jgi:hypothetical protein